MKAILISIVLTTNLYANMCDDLYAQRGKDISTINSAINCYKNNKPDNNKLSYLYFFKATYFAKDKLENLKTSYEYALDEIQKYGGLYDSAIYKDLDTSVRKNIALSYYLYGTSIAQYVDLKGKFEAIKRMSDIKNSMNTILRMKLPETYYYGAFRTLAIFYYKVPGIAGGSNKKARNYFSKLMKLSTKGIVSSYPVNHLFYAQFLKNTNSKADACTELQKIMNLTDGDIFNNYQEIYYETLKDREDAVTKYRAYSC